ncbi:hypothetical protein BASA81_003829 [Batrachochytrium salamandrivorans]|nr:hypothetical protein BASA81_003829 [Batrachochytrium salamandrivorans]
MEIAVGSSVRVLTGAKPEIAGAIGTVTGILSSQYQVVLSGDEAIHILSPGEVELISGEEEDDDEPALSSSPQPPTLAAGGEGSTTPEEAVSGTGEDEEEEEEEDVASSTWPVWPSRKEATQTSLSQVDKTTWIGRPVMVMKGPKTGSLGRVFSTASGWVEIHEAGKDGSDPFLVTSGEAPPINKRAHELNLLKLFSRGEEEGGDGGDDNGDEELSMVSSSGTPREMQVGDVVVVLEGAHEGKNGKITEIEGDQLALSIKAVSAIVHKTKSQVELKKETQQARVGSTATALPPTRRGPKKKDDLLGKRVMIIDTGKVGVVSRAGDGLFEVEVPGYDAEMKRRSEIKLVEGDEGAGAAAAEGEEDSDDEGNGNGSAANRVRRKRKLRAPSSTAAAAQDDEDKKRSRITRRGMPPSTAPATNANKKPSASSTTSNGGSASNNNNNGNNESYPVTKLEATRKQRQEVITYFVSRCKERQDKQMPNRENLQEWLDDIKGQSFFSSCQCCEKEEGQDFTSVPLLFDFPFCAWCRVEKEDEADFCWNAACWKSPVFRPNAPSLGSAVPSLEISRVCFVNPCSQVSISPLVTLNLMGSKPDATTTTAAAVLEGGYFGQGYQEDAPTRLHALDRRWKHQKL